MVQGDLNLELEHFKYHRRQGMEQVYKELGEKLGLKGEVLKAATRQVGESDNSLVPRSIYPQNNYPQLIMRMIGFIVEFYEGI